MCTGCEVSHAAPDVHGGVNGATLLQMCVGVRMEPFCPRCAQAVKTCGLRTRASYGSTRVVGGTDAQPGAWPWIVSVQELWEQGAAHKCGGSLISSQWVLTAAHCFVTVRTDAMWRVVAGATQLSRLGPEAQVRHVRRVLSHKYYDYGTQENDIALVELDHPIQCNDYIQLACVADATVRVSELTSCYVSGWGSTSARSAIASDVLQEAQVHLIDLQLCNSTWWYGGAIHSHNVCAGYPQGGIDTCQVGARCECPSGAGSPGTAAPALPAPALPGTAPPSASSARHSTSQRQLCPAQHLPAPALPGTAPPSASSARHSTSQRQLCPAQHLPAPALPGT
ncbi:Acr, partial [Columba guinea]